MKRQNSKENPRRRFCSPAFLKTLQFFLWVLHRKSFLWSHRIFSLGQTKPNLLPGVHGLPNAPVDRVLAKNRRRCISCSVTGSGWLIPESRSVMRHRSANHNTNTQQRCQPQHQSAAAVQEVFGDSHQPEHPSRRQRLSYRYFKTFWLIFQLRSLSKLFFCFLGGEKIQH